MLFRVWPGFRILGSTADTMQTLRVKGNECMLCPVTVLYLNGSAIFDTQSGDKRTLNYLRQELCLNRNKHSVHSVIMKTTSFVLNFWMSVSHVCFLFSSPALAQHSSTWRMCTPAWPCVCSWRQLEPMCMLSPGSSRYKWTVWTWRPTDCTAPRDVKF